ncbi:E3 UFM1-protein ligase 1 [Fasciola gigantica]|uniref:E3 UFM1-protein ligase 1 n=1 Tax=Fasciola gigantica TaxID=46835 RepID=A0A504YT61_FASGI|nr:E3 UFM1-protein ligase 1 [Fasciola gigantica]
MATWSEIRDLANKLKTAQERRCAQTLSERTWVDVVRHLMDTNRLKLIFTTDGRSYITKQELEKEIREEVEAHSGRISVVEIASNIDVDPLIVEARASEMIAGDAQDKSSNRLLSLPGELIDESYVRKVAHEIQDIFEERGQVSIGELATVFGLTTAFLLHVINEYQGTLFRIHKYGEKYLTDVYLNTNRAKVRGFFTALMRPVTLSNASVKLGIAENLLSSIVSSLISSGQLCGSLMAGRGTFVPSCYTSAEDTYITAFYNQNGYVEWSYLKRLGIPEPGAYLRNLLPKATHLSGVSVGPVLLDQLKATIDEAVRESSWIDLTHCLPSGLDSKERMEIIAPYIKKAPLQPVAGGIFVVSDTYISQCEGMLEKFLKTRAQEVFNGQRRSLPTSSTYTIVESDQPHKRATQASKGGFGFGAREVKTKNVKKKYIPGKKKSGFQGIVDYDEGTTVNQRADGFMAFSKHVNEDELNQALADELRSDVPDEVVEGVITYLMPKLERTFVKIIESLVSEDTGSRRGNIGQTQEATNNMVFSIQLIERGINAIMDERLQTTLLRYLIKNHGVCVVDKLCEELARYHGLTWPPDSAINLTESNLAHEQISSEERQKFVDQLKHLNTPEATKSASALHGLLEKIRAFLSGCCSTTDFYSALDSFAIEHVGIKLPTLHAHPDNKRKREEKNKANELALQFELQLTNAYEQFKSTPDLQHAATAALAAVCLFSQVVTGWPISAPGRCVPELVTWLSNFVESKQQAPSLPPAVGSFVSSSAVDNLSLLTGYIAQHMHVSDQMDMADQLSKPISELLNVARECRKQLYA